MKVRYCTFLRLLLNFRIIFLLTTFLWKTCDAQDFYAGFYSYHPAYLNDRHAARRIIQRIPLGLPVGGPTEHGKGLPSGLMAYVVKLGGWQNMWTAYHSLTSPFAAQKVFGQPILFEENYIAYWR
ncbi:hypothetical protein B4U80_09756 [Leptotrombidium deliense]|uniref:Uncharacterized protein n=1 Tax=Leptotrombidium deliense TaxID=299467 RepID=A0A443SI25_9ACAR|nr:hypothetical protein B4U80_09756 [Leptotrombidium deliense]